MHEHTKPSKRYNAHCQHQAEHQPTLLALIELKKIGLKPGCPEPDKNQVGAGVTCNLSWIFNSRKRFCTLGYALHASLATERYIMPEQASHLEDKAHTAGASFGLRFP